MEMGVIGKSGANPALTRNRKWGRKPRVSHCLPALVDGKARWLGWFISR